MPPSKARQMSLSAKPELTLAQAVYTSGQATPPALCSGLGTCGKCRLKILTAPPAPHKADLDFFTKEQLEAGWRLGCRHQCIHDVTVKLPEQIARHNTLFSDKLKGKGPFLLAVDLGTTSLHWQLLSKGSPEGPPTIWATESELNPQMGAGSEIMSRLAFAQTPKGLQTMQQAVCSRLQNIIAETGNEIADVCVAGNSAMTYLLLGKSISTLSSAPYSLPYKGGTTEELPNLPAVYIPPLPAPFVGADLTAGYIALTSGTIGTRPEYPFLLADLGTNGEFILALSEEEALVTSVALGPALEGIGLTFGTVAQRGALTGFTLSPIGLEPQQIAHEDPVEQEYDGYTCITCQNAPSRKAQTSGSLTNTPAHISGLSGTGYLSLIHQLKKAGLIQEDGRFASPPYSPLATRLAQNLIQSGTQQRFQLTESIYLSAGDIEEVLKVKAAFSLAFSCLLQKANLSAGELSGIYLAGALGEHAPVNDLEGLGFIPQGMKNKVHAIGNASLKGAAHFLIDPSSRSVSERWTANTTIVDLTAAPHFTQNFMRHMRYTFI